MTRFIDISLTISPDFPTWPGDPVIAIERTVDMSKGDPANVSEIRLGTHTCTHVDPPIHFVAGGAAIDEISLDQLNGPVFVADFRGHAGPIGPSELDSALPDGTERFLMQTDNSGLWTTGFTDFPTSYVALSPQGAQWAVDKGIRVVGTDFLSIEVFKAPGHPTHMTLLRNGVCIVEGLDLRNVAPGAYDFYCFPLKIKDGDGGPARAALVKR